MLNSDFSETFSKTTAINDASNVPKQNDNNVCIDLYPDNSIDEGYDALEYEDCNKIRINKLRRQRSYSVDESVSIVFASNVGDGETSTTSEIPCKSNILPIEDTDDSSYIQFVSDSHSNATGIDKNSENVSNIHNEDDVSCKDTRVVCIDESKSNIPKKGHRRNFSLDSKKLKSSRKPRENIYLYIQMQLCQAESLRDWLQKNKDLNVRKNIVRIIFEWIQYNFLLILTMNFYYSMLTYLNKL